MWLSILTIKIFLATVIILEGAANLSLTVYVYKKNPKERLNRSFLYLGLSVVLWELVTFISLIFPSLFWFRVGYSISFFMPTTGIFFAHALADKKMQNWVKIFLPILAVTFFIIGILTPLLLKSVVAFSILGSNEIFGPFFGFWGITLTSLVLIALYIPYSIINRINERRKKQIEYFLAGCAAVALWAIPVSIILPLFGFTTLSAFDSLSPIFLVGFTSYSIIKYNLMNIRSLLFHAFVYSIVIISIVAFLLGLVFVSSYLLQNLMIWPIYAIIVGVAIALFFIGRSFFVEKRDLEKAKVDLTESLRVSEENRIKAETERRKTATIITNFSDGLIILDEKNEIFLVNPQAERMLEVKEDKLLKKTIQSLSGLQRGKSIASILATGFEGFPKKEVEFAKEFIVELSVIPLSLDKNDIGHLIVLHDISREKMIDRMKTEFVSLAAHQLRTPLSVIKWSMSMLGKGDFGKLTPKQNNAVKSALSNDERMISLVDSLLNITHIEEGRYLYETKLADIKKIVEVVIENNKDEIKRKKVKMDLQLQDGLPEIKVDLKKIELVVQNLLDNALKYSPDGSAISISLKKDEENIQFEIRDSGIGIPENQQEKIFTKFFRGDNAVKVAAFGSGLGLFLSQNIIEAHGGKIWFESPVPSGAEGEENKGTAFYFDLPIL